MSEILRKEIQEVLDNPAAVQSLALSNLRRAMNGEIEFIDPTNPFIAAIETSSVMTSAAVTRYENLTKRQYPRNAQNEDEVYLHMSDKDYIDRFAQPAQTKVSFIFNKDEIIRRLVLDTNTGIRKMQIPRHTTITVAGIPFTTEYPVEIRQLLHGALQIVYDTSRHSPFMQLETNLISYKEINEKHITYITFEIDVVQYSIVSESTVITPSTPFVIHKSIDDQFFYIRVWKENPDLSWTEIQTTHSAQVYDPNKLTAVIRVDKHLIKVSIPQIYLKEDTNIGRIRADIYQTKGPISLNLRNFSMPAFKAVWNYLDNNEKTPFTTAINKLETIQIHSDHFVYGGRNALTFEELRERVITNTVGPKNRPITPDQIRISLMDKGYEIVKNIDNITNRTFLASRRLPTPRHDKLITPANTSIQTALFAIDDIKDYPDIIDNGDSITILPSQIFKNVNGSIRFVPKQEIEAIRLLSPDQQALRFNEGNYYFTPFHYVMDFSEERFDVRSYHLDTPMAKSKTFISENDTTLLGVSIKDYELRKTDKGYEIILSTDSTEPFKELEDRFVHVHLAFKPKEERDYAYLEGILERKDETGERVYRFPIHSTLRVNNKNGLELTSFLMYDKSLKKIECNLTQDFEVFFSTSAFIDTSKWIPNELDNKLPLFLLPPRRAGITHERIQVVFGKHLKSLWTRNRSVSSEVMYEKYEDDVVGTYKEDVYEVNPETGLNFFIENDEIVRRIKHRAGEVMKDDGNNPVILHRKGEIKLTEDGRPKRISERKLYRQVDFLLVEGAYLFATDPIAQEYQLEMTEILVNWITNDIEGFIPQLLEKTEIFFYPKHTTSSVNIMFGAGLTTSINANQSLRVEIHIKPMVSNNDDFRKQIQNKTILIISQHLEKTVVSISDITSELRRIYGDEVLDVRITGLGGASNFPMVTIMNDTDRLSIGKRLVARPDGILLVEEDVTFNFIRHGKER